MTDAEIRAMTEDEQRAHLNGKTADELCEWISRPDLLKCEWVIPSVLKVTHLKSGESICIFDEPDLGAPLTLKAVRNALITLNMFATLGPFK